MKKLRVQNRLEEGKPIFFIKIMKMEVCFWQKEAAECALNALLELLRRNGGLAKRNEREKMANMLANRGDISAANLVRGIPNVPATEN